MLRIAVLALAAIFATPALADDVSMDASKAPAGTYKLETAHSQVLFYVKHIGLTDYYGRFNKVSGTLNFNPAAPEHSAAAINIDTTTLDTPSDALNSTLKSSLFDTAHFSSATFKSTSMTVTGRDRGQITGDLTIRGVTKPVTLDVTFTGTELNPLDNSRVLGFHATGTIKRTDYGMTGMIWEPLVSDDIKLIIEAMFQREAD